MEAIDLAPETYPIAYLTRISPRGREPKTFLMSDMTNGNGLKFKVSLNTIYCTSLTQKAHGTYL